MTDKVGHYGVHPDIGESKTAQLEKIVNAHATEFLELRKLREENKKLRKVAEAAYRSYPTLHSHMIHCDVHRKDGVCTCGKRESDVALGEALRAWKGG